MEPGTEAALPEYLKPRDTTRAELIVEEIKKVLKEKILSDYPFEDATEYREEWLEMLLTITKMESN